MPSPSLCTLTRSFFLAFCLLFFSCFLFRSLSTSSIVARENPSLFKENTSLLVVFPRRKEKKRDETR